MTYDEFIKGINDPNEIKQIDFYVEGYTHFNKCSIGRYIDKVRVRGIKKTVAWRITCILTKDHTEDVSFFKTFEEDYKLFNFGSKGKYTLKDVWDKIVITNIEYFKIKKGK